MSLATLTAYRLIKVESNGLSISSTLATVCIRGSWRGLASNLNRLGVDDSVIQAILRHSHVSVTQACYIKTNRPELEAAMRNFSEELRKCSQVVLENEGSETPQVLQ